MADKYVLDDGISLYKFFWASFCVRSKYKWILRIIMTSKYEKMNTPLGHFKPSLCGGFFFTSVNKTPCRNMAAHMNIPHFFNFRELMSSLITFCISKNWVPHQISHIFFRYPSLAHVAFFATMFWNEV